MVLIRASVYILATGCCKCSCLPHFCFRCYFVTNDLYLPATSHLIQEEGQQVSKKQTRKGSSGGGRGRGRGGSNKQKYKDDVDQIEFEDEEEDEDD